MKKLFTAIRQGKFDEVRLLIENKPELVNCVSGATPKKDRGQSPLQVALKTGNNQIADYLIQHGADVNFMEEADDDLGLRAPALFDAITGTIVSLCYDAIDGSEAAYAIISLLIEKGADVNKLASNGYGAIDWAISQAENIFERESAYPDIQDITKRQLTRILDILIENGADCSAWAKRSYVAAPYEGPSNKSTYVDDFTPANENDVDRTQNTRAFLQDYFRSRGLKV